VGRVTAVYNSANAIGLYLGPIFFLTLSQIKKDISNFLVHISLVLIMVAIILSKSEGALVSLVIVIFIMLLTLKLKFKHVLISIISTIFLISLVILFTNHFSNLFIPQISDSSYADTNTLQIRAYLWKGTSSLLSDHPLFGAGINGFKTEYFNNYKLAQYDEALQYPHNMILNFWTELGFGGAVWIIGIYAYLLYKLRVSKIGNDNNYQFRFFILMAFLYSFIHGLVDVPYFKNDLSLQFWILLALIKTEEKHFMDSSKRRD
jgi:O-antigen ligase